MSNPQKSQLVKENTTLLTPPTEMERTLIYQPFGEIGLPPSDFIADGRDVDPQQKQIALEESETSYRRLFETAKDGILILDGDTGRIIDANPFLQDMLGYAEHELVGKAL